MFNPINYLITRIRGRRLFKDPCDIKKRVAILNFSYGNFNFGAILLSYASQSVLGKLGYTPYILNFNPEFKNYWRLSRIRGNIAGINFSLFRYKYLNTTRIYYNYKSLLKSNDDFSTFIFGSDQIWRRSRPSRPRWPGSPRPRRSASPCRRRRGRASCCRRRLC